MSAYYNSFVQPTYVMTWELFKQAKLSEGTLEYTLDKYHICLRKFNDWLFVQDVKPTKTTVQQFLVHLHSLGLGPFRIRNYWVALMSFYTWADTEGILSSPNPMIGVKAPKLPKGIIKIYTTNEIEAMLNEVEDVITYTAISVLWKTGIRGAELLKINRKDIDTAQQTIHIHGKGAKDRLVPYDSYCATLFELRLTNLQRSDQIFPTTIPQIRKSLRYICKLSNVPYRAPHCFRHTFACNYLKAGGSPLDLMYILGHSTLAMVNHYSQWLASDRACDNYHKLFATV